MDSLRRQYTSRQVSRLKKDNQSTAVSRKTLTYILNKLHLPKITVDAFATVMNRRSRKFISRFPEPNAWRWDAFQVKKEELEGETVWCNPPLLGK